MHARVAGNTWQGRDTGEHYDLVVVGAGISGLTAAYLYRQAKPGGSVGHALASNRGLGGSVPWFLLAFPMGWLLDGPERRPVSWRSRVQAPSSSLLCSTGRQS